MIGGELTQPGVLQENVYNMDETGILLSVLNSLKVLVGSGDLRKHRGAGVQRTLVTAIECISADGRYLDPLIVWPASTHRSNWTTYATPGWHFACSRTGYTDSEINLYWVRNVFDPLTRERANGKPRMLISDGFATHESLEVLTYCFENNITLCRLPSHTSHKLQPCDVGVFGPLKAAYREQVELLYRGGADTIGKQHFTFLYSRARETAFSSRNIRAGWSRAGLFPFNPERILQGMPKQVDESSVTESEQNETLDWNSCAHTLHTPTTSTSLLALRHQLDEIGEGLDNDSRLYIQKLANAAENAFTDRALLLDENRTLFAQNNEKSVRQSTKSTVVGKAKIVRFEDIAAAKERRERTESRRARLNKRTTSCTASKQNVTREVEIKDAEIQIAAMGLSDFCSVLRL